MKNEYKSYKDKNPYKNRCEESISIRAKYPNHVPVIIDIGDESLKLNKYKFLVPYGTYISYLVYKIRKQLVLESYKGIFLFCDNIMLCNIDNIEDIYENYLIRNKIEKYGDQFLYMRLQSENVFGNNI